MNSLPLDRLETVSLDVGNTLLTIDFDLVESLLAGHGIETDVTELVRAERTTRPALSRRIASGASSESEDSFSFYVGQIFEELARGGRTNFPDGLDLARFAESFARELKADFPSSRLWSREIPGVRRALADLRAGDLTLIAVSNSDGTVAEALRLAGLYDFFSVVADSSDVGVEKPDPRIFEWAFERAGARPETTVHLGDLYAIDVVGARAAGAEAILVDPADVFRDAPCPRCEDLGAFAEAVGGRRRRGVDE